MLICFIESTIFCLLKTLVKILFVQFFLSTFKASGFLKVSNTTIQKEIVDKLVNIKG